MDPTWTEIADKSIDNITHGVQRVADAVEKLAPGAWVIAVHKQRVEGALDLGLGLLGAIGIVAGYRWFLVRSEKFDQYDRGPARGFAGVAALALLIVCVGAIRFGVLQTINSEYYAARELSGVLHGH